MMYKHSSASNDKLPNTIQTTKSEILSINRSMKRLRHCLSMQQMPEPLDVVNCISNFMAAELQSELQCELGQLS